MTSSNHHLSFTSRSEDGRLTCCVMCFRHNCWQGFSADWRALRGLHLAVAKRAATHRIMRRWLLLVIIILRQHALRDHLVAIERVVVACGQLLQGSAVLSLRSLLRVRMVRLHVSVLLVVSFRARSLVGVTEGVVWRLLGKDVILWIRVVIVPRSRAIVLVRVLVLWLWVGPDDLPTLPVLWDLLELRLVLLDLLFEDHFVWLNRV